MLRSASSLAMALALVLSACGPFTPCDAVYCGPGRCEDSSGEAVCECPYGYVQADMTCKRNLRHGDDHGDSIDAATPLEFMALNEVKAAVLDTVDDVDVFSFRVTAGRIYRFNCRRFLDEGHEGTDPTCVVELLGAGGRTLPGSAGSGAPGYYRASVLATQDGTAYARVKGLFAPTIHPSYDYSLVDRGPNDFGDTLAEAGQWSVGNKVEGNIEPYGDVDVIALDLVAGHTYQLLCRAGDSNDCGMRVRGPGGEVLFQAGDLFNLQVTQSGRHTVELFFTTGPRFSLCVGPYTFSSTDLTP
ncbi:hypothetical protein ACQKGO_04085 [Corallococcus interemptor]|uniref:hypothetical protein n=1 Tax=Corallococcus interemptor TaxID=2316720 RepID=UPI003CFCDBBF